MRTSPRARHLLSLAALCGLALAAGPSLSFASPQDGLSAPVVTPIPRPRGPVRCVEGSAGPYPCQAIDQASYVPLNSLTQLQTDNVGGVLGWTDPASGREFALVTLVRKVSAVEVTDPENPRLVGELGVVPPPDTVSRMAIYQDHLYVTTARGLLDVFDLSGLLTASGPPVRFPPVTEIDLIVASGLEINEETGFAYLFFGSSFSPGRVVALDLKADPADPQEVFEWNPGPSYPQNLECVVYHGPDTRFTGHEICFGAAPRRSLVIYDVSDKDNPVKLSRTFYRRFNTPWQVAVTPDHRFLLLADSHDEFSYRKNTRTFLWDLSSLTEPVQFNSYDGPTRARDLHMEIRGRFLFLANGKAGLRIVDLRRIGRGGLREVAFFDMEPVDDATDWFGAVQVDVLPSGTVLVGSVRQGLYVLRPRL